MDRGMAISRHELQNRHEYRTRREVAPVTKQNQSIDVVMITKGKRKDLKMNVTKCNYRGHNYCEAKSNGNTYLLCYKNGYWKVQNQI